MTSERPPDPLVKLRAIVDAFPGAGYAVVDGGHFPDLPADFRRQRLFARSLFLATADPEVQAAGPWLVALGQAPDATDKVFALVGEKPAAVFWCCDAGETALWRHLRGLNVARIPTWAAEGNITPRETDSPSLFEPAMFRHWDPRVLGALMPTLDEAQFSRVLGPAGELAFRDLSKLRRIVADQNWPQASSSTLTIRAEQIQALGSRREAGRIDRTIAYLRETAPHDTSALSDDHMRELVGRYQASGQRVGLTHERSQSIWCFLMMTSQDRFERLPKVRAYLQHGPGNPDENLETLLGQMVRLAATHREIV